MGVTFITRNGACLMPLVNKNKCISCKKCVKKCPVDAISMVKGKAFIDDIKCINCGKCVKVCPVKAILKDKDKVKSEVEENISMLKKALADSKSSKSRRRIIKAKRRQIDLQRKVLQGTLKKMKHLKK